MPRCHSSAGAWTGVTCFRGVPTRSDLVGWSFSAECMATVSRHTAKKFSCASAVYCQCRSTIPWPMIGNLGCAACTLGHYRVPFFCKVEEGLLSGQPGCRPTVTTGWATCCNGPRRDCTRSTSCSLDLVLTSLCCGVGYQCNWKSSNLTDRASHAFNLTTELNLQQYQIGSVVRQSEAEHALSSCRCRGAGIGPCRDAARHTGTAERR